MNAPARHPVEPANEALVLDAGSRRRGFTTAEVERMVETGVIGGHERLELIYGRIRRNSDSDADYSRRNPSAWRPFTTAEVEKLYAVGILAPDERVELIEGTLIQMSPKHRKHEHYKRRLSRWLGRRLGPEFAVGIEQTLYLADGLFVEPDIIVTRDDMPSDAARGPDALLLIEIADTSFGHDLGVKRRLYATYGVQDYWVVDAETGRVFIHRAPEPDGEDYLTVLQGDADSEIAPLFDERLKLRLSEIV